MGRLPRIAAALAIAGAGAASAWFLFEHRQAGLDRHRVQIEAESAAVRGDRAQAARVLDGFLADHPRDVELLIERARVAQSAGDYNEARNRYVQAVTVDPRHAGARAALFDLTFQARARQEAEHHLERLEALLGPTSPEVTARKRLLESARPK
jgi:Tfp pilus assembly protein PilF